MRDYRPRGECGVGGVGGGGGVGVGGVGEGGCWTERLVRLLRRVSREDWPSLASRRKLFWVWFCKLLGEYKCSVV